MAVTLNRSAFVASGSQSFSLSSMFATAAGLSNPAYLVVTALDRAEYTLASTNATGLLSGNGATAGLSGTDGDGRVTGLVFAYQASTGRYVNSSFGYFDQLRYTASSSANDITDISVFTTNSFALANADAGDVYTLMQDDPGGFVGTATVATQPGVLSAPTHATPLSVAAAAASFVGDAWNRDGCWILASTIAAEAGAALPVQSTAIGLPGQANGEWLVAFNGPTGQSGNWQAMVRIGEMIVFGTPDGGGHITTCVSGSGSTAMLIDNITYENYLGQITNAANDGSAADVTIAAAHLASEEWSGVQAGSVVIYELDTPIVAATGAGRSVTAGSIQSLASLFAVSDPGNKPIVSFQIYDISSGAFTINGVNQAAHSPATALSTTSLSATGYAAPGLAGSDTIELRAFNGIYWSDWQAEVLTAISPTPVIATPSVTAQTAAQSWQQGQRVSLTLPASTFADPQGQTLSYAASLAGGQALPSWLVFNPATRNFTGHVPSGVQSFAIAVTATDSSGLSASEQFNVTVAAVAPVLAIATPAQNWLAGQHVTLALPAATFSDPQGQALTYTATQTNGQALPSWFSFNAATESFSGTAPITPQTIGLKVTATDTSGLSVAENFVATIRAAAPVLASQTPNLQEIDGRTFSFALPANTFSDAAGQHLNYVAYQVGGANATSWLHFSAATQTLSGTPPLGASGTVRIEIVATDSNKLSASEMFNLTYSPGH